MLPIFAAREGMIPCQPTPPTMIPGICWIRRATGLRHSRPTGARRAPKPPTAANSTPPPHLVALARAVDGALKDPVHVALAGDEAGGAACGQPVLDGEALCVTGVEAGAARQLHAFEGVGAVDVVGRVGPPPLQLDAHVAALER